MYYTGHAKERGDWIYDDDSYITLKQILRVWRTSDVGHHQGAMLLIIADSCYSGAWVRKLDWYHRHGMYENVGMVAASTGSTRYRNGEGSYFTKAICEGSPCPHTVTFTHTLQRQKSNFITIEENFYGERIITLQGQSVHTLASYEPGNLRRGNVPAGISS